MSRAQTQDTVARLNLLLRADPNAVSYLFINTICILDMLNYLNKSSSHGYYIGIRLTEDKTLIDSFIVHRR